MATVYIYVSRNGKSKNLKLRDSNGKNPGNDKITTDVDRGDTVIWELDPKGSNLFSLNGVEKKQSSAYDLLEGPPVPQKNGSYKGKVKKKKKLIGKKESYYIKYKIKKDDHIRTDDPKLKIIK